MKRILIVVLSALMLGGCAEKEEEGHSSMIVTAGGEVVSAYWDGEDVTEERKALEVQTEEAVSRFLNREREKCYSAYLIPSIKLMSRLIMSVREQLQGRLIIIITRLQIE